MTDAVERVARAMQEACGDEGCWSLPAESWRSAARAAILALREPDVEMIAAFWRQKNTGSQEPRQFTDQRDDYSAWRAAIDAALGDPA